jgi:hypothetical protein
MNRCHVCSKITDKIYQCSACKLTKYCSKRCQAIDWKTSHRNQCGSPGSSDSPDSPGSSGSSGSPPENVCSKADAYRQTAMSMFRNTSIFDVLSSALLNKIKRNCAFVIFIFEHERFHILFTVDDIPDDLHQDEVRICTEKFKIRGSPEDFPLLICRVFGLIDCSTDNREKFSYRNVGDYKTLAYHRYGVELPREEREKRILDDLNLNIESMSNGGFVLFDGGDSETVHEYESSNIITLLIGVQSGGVISTENSLLGSMMVAR